MVDEIFDWVPARKASSHYGVTQQTLRNWSEEGIIGFRRTPGGRYHYALPKAGQDAACKESVIYARVSSSKQKGDLARQVDFLRGKYPSHRVITDVGSGVNFKRRGLLALLDASIAGLIGEVVVAHRDRLARIGYGLLEHIFLRSGSVLTVVEDHACDGCPAELHEDVMAVLTHFTAKHHGRRSYSVKGKRKGQGQGGQGENPPDGGTEGDLP
jgi:predicted site-specific integrase-resolvase